MNDPEATLRREVQELRAEVTRLRRAVECGLAVIAVAAAVIFPDLLRVGVFVGVMIIFALLVSPVRRLIFSSFLRKPHTYEQDD
jgi:hypothetical protein